MRPGIVVNVTPVDCDLRRLSRTAARRRNTCGAPTSFWPRLTAAAPPRSCAARANQARRVALAGSVHGRRRRRADARQDAQAREAATTVQRVVDLALGPPPGEVTHWTGRMLAKAVGISLRSVQRFAQLTSRRLKRGVFTSVADLKAAINRFVEETNSDPKPFVWTADPKRVLAAVKRGKQALESLH